jgi:hypothetical protein
MKPIFFFAILTGVLAGCSKYEVQYEGPYNDSSNQVQTQITYEVLTVENGRIVLYNRNLSLTKTLDNLPAGIVKASINHTHDRIAYKIPGQNVAIVDSTGAQVDAISGSAGAEWFDWHANNQTLCLLTGTTLSFWGPALSVPTTNLAGLFPTGSSDRTMFCAVVTGNGSMVAAYRYYAGFSSGYQSRITILPPTGAPKHTVIGSSDEARWLRADRSGNRVLGGTVVSGSIFKTWEIDVSAQTISQTQARSFAAPGPSPEQTAYWQNGDLTVYHSGINEWFNFRTGPDSVTALDW